MSDKTPRVSIGMPVYNGEKFIVCALDSLLAQHFEDFELIIADNASDDATEEICREYAARDPRIRYYRNESNIGGPGNHSRVFEQSTGEYFKWAHHDDWIAPDFLQRCVEVLDREPSVVLCCTKTVIIYEDKDFVWGGKRARQRSLERRQPLNESGAYEYYEKDVGDLVSTKAHERFDKLIRSIELCNPQFGLIRRSVLQKTRLLENYGGSDYVLLAHLSLLGKFNQVPEPLLFRRLHSEAAQSSTNNTNSWLDPANKRRMVMPTWRLFYGYLSLIMRAEVGFARKAYLAMRTLRRFRKYQRRMRREARQAARQIIWRR